MISDSNRYQVTEIFGALSHPVRLRIVELLIDGEQTVGDVAAKMSIGQSGASQHLAILTRAGLLLVEPRGTSRIYRVKGPRIAQILILMDEFCDMHGLGRIN